MILQEVAAGVRVFVSPGIRSNAFVLQGSKFVLVDSGTSPAAGLLKQALALEGIGVEDIAAVIHTHGHADHFGASFLFHRARLLMSAFDAERVRMHDDAFTFAGLFGMTAWPSIDRVLRDGEWVRVGGFEFEVLATPGHTAGSLCFLERNHGWLFSGDTLFAGTCGRLDVPSASALDMKASLRRIRDLRYSLLLPGHGKLVSSHFKVNVDASLSMLGP